MNIVLLSPPSPDREAILGALRSAAHDVTAVDTATLAAARLAQAGTELIVVDLAAADALRFLRKHAGMRGYLPVVCIADRRKIEASSEALRLGIVDIVGRPVSQEELVTAVGNAGEYVRLARSREPYESVEEPPVGVFGASPAMRDVLGLVRRVAQSRCSVLIMGERGTGRETIARAIHTNGPRRGREFVKVLCGEVTSTEFEQVVNDVVADGTTVYLENIGELAMELQIRLEGRVLRPVSGDASAHDVRFIAAAQPRIVDFVERGIVRRTLIDALSVVRIDLPPLRQRSQDIPLLAMHFLKEASRASDVPAKTFSHGALTLLAALPWTGNAGELRSLCERLVVLVPRGVVLLEDVLANVRFDGAQAIGRSQGSLKEARDRFERDFVTAVLQHHRGRMGAAARELGIERTNLYRKVKQLNITWTIPD